jgi:cytochrome P450
MIGAMNRDPAHFANADRFDPWRSEPTGHAAFGFGTASAGRAGKSGDLF